MNRTEAISSRLKQLREDRQQTQEYVAKKLRISKTALSNYERGSSLPDTETLALLAVHYNVSAEYLMGMTDFIGPADSLNRPLCGRQDITLMSCISSIQKYSQKDCSHLHTFLKMLLLMQEHPD